VSHALLVGLVAASLGLAAPPGMAQAPATCLHPGTRAEALPQLSAEFRRAGAQDYESQVPGAGCSIRFEHASGLWIDVYIYRAGLGEIEDRSRDPQLMELFQDGALAMVQKWQTQGGGKVRELQARYADRGTGKIEIMAASAYLEPPDAQRTLRSHLMLWSGAGSIWKLRATYPVGAQGMSDDAVLQLADLLVDWSRERP
jgi:hypothetical protein